METCEKQLLHVKDEEKQDGGDVLTLGQETMVLVPFPTEVWAMVLKEVDSDTLVSLRLTWHKLRQLTDERRTTLLFDKVLPLLLPHLQKQDVINCGQVCSRWREAVSSTIRTLFTNVPYEPGKDPFVVPLDKQTQLVTRYDNIMDYRDLQRWNKHFGDQETFLVQCKSVVLIEPHGANMVRQFPPIGLPFLKRYGRNVLALMVQFDGFSPLGRQPLKWFLVECLGQLPNLKRFSLELHAEHEEFKDSWDEVELPPLTKLDTLCLTSVGESCPRRFIACYGHSLSRLCLSASVSTFCKILQEYPQINDISMSKMLAGNLKTTSVTRIITGNVKRRVKLELSIEDALYDAPHVISEDAIFTIVYVMNAYIFDLHCAGRLDVRHKQNWSMPTSGIDTGLESLMLCSFDVNIDARVLKTMTSISQFVIGPHRPEDWLPPISLLTAIGRHDVEQGRCPEKWKKCFQRVFKWLPKLKVIHCDKGNKGCFIKEGKFGKYVTNYSAQESSTC